MKKLLLLMVCSITLITACSQADDSLKGNESQLEIDKAALSESLSNKENKIEKLTRNIAELEKQIESNEKEKDFFPHISNMSREFVKAHTSGDKEQLRQLLSEDIMIEDRDNKLYYVKNDKEEWVLFSYEGETQLDDWVIQGFQYYSESNTFRIQIREFYIDLNGESVSPPTFLGLTFKMSNNEWKIISLAFDV